MTFWVGAHDIMRGFEKGGVANLTAVPILVVWLYGTLVLAERRSGYIILLLGSLLALGMPIIHMRGAGVGGEFAKSSGAFFFVWTLLALGVTGTFSLGARTVEPATGPAPVVQQPEHGSLYQKGRFRVSPLPRRASRRSEGGHYLTAPSR